MYKIGTSKILNKWIDVYLVNSKLYTCFLHSKAKIIKHHVYDKSHWNMNMLGTSDT